MAAAGPGRRGELGIEVDERSSRYVTPFVRVSAGRPAELPANVEERRATEQLGQFVRGDQRRGDSPRLPSIRTISISRPRSRSLG
jgi:hypothetical protein